MYAESEVVHRALGNNYGKSHAAALGDRPVGKTGNISASRVALKLSFCQYGGILVSYQLIEVALLRLEGLGVFGHTTAILAYVCDPEEIMVDHSVSDSLAGHDFYRVLALVKVIVYRLYSGHSLPEGRLHDLVNRLASVEREALRHVYGVVCRHVAAVCSLTVSVNEIKAVKSVLIDVYGIGKLSARWHVYRSSKFAALRHVVVRACVGVCLRSKMGRVGVLSLIDIAA